MPRVNFTRTDRIAQMSKQEQLIAQKRQQILEKQRTLQMAKQIAAEASKTAPAGAEDEPGADSSGTLKLPFSNDGSFLENFKKLSEKFAKTAEDGTKRAAEEEVASTSEKKFKPDEATTVAILPPPPPPLPPPSMPTIASTTYAYGQLPPMMSYSQDMMPVQLQPPMMVIESQQQQQQQQQLELQQQNYPGPSTVPPPPPQPPVLEQVPEVGANCKVLSENDKLPTTVEELVELVADIGDVYEEKLSSRKNELHPSLWFLFEKQSDAYRNYRHMIVAKLFKTAGLVGHELPSIQQQQQPPPAVASDDSKYDPADVLDDTNLDELEDSQQQQFNDGEPIQMQPNYYGDERHFYDDKSTTETDSDTEYVREARKRNLKNLKHKTMNAGNVREEQSSSDSDDDFRDSPDSKSEGRGGGGDGEKGNGSGSGGRSNRQKQRKKSRWGDQSESVETTDMTGEGQGFTEDGCSGMQDDQKQLFHQSSRSNPGFLQFVFQNYGTVEVSPEAWKLAEEHFRIRLLYEDMSDKIQRHERYTSNRLMNDPNEGPVDIEEDRRMNTDKMKAVLLWINEITKLYERCQPSNLRDFLMRDEFESFSEKFQTNENDRFPNFEDYKKFKLEQAKIVSTNSRGEYSSSDSAVLQNATASGDGGQMMNDNAKRRKSRWGDQVPIQTMPNPAANQPSSSNQSANAPKLTNLNRTDPALLAYVRQNFGSTNLSEEDWKKAEDHYKINLLYQDMLRKRQEIDRLAASGKFKYEYDSDEDVTGGTWEHKLRSQEMEATQLWANELTKKSEGKHHIGDFLPPEELRKFMEKYDAQKNNRQPNLSDYKEYKLKEDNVGFQMLQKLGWKEGQGLGADGSGIVDPINKASQRDNNQGLGVAAGDNPDVDDNEYDQYRKRMMLAYRFRPNPLNNPRRAYY